MVDSPYQQGFLRDFWTINSTVPHTWFTRRPQTKLRSIEMHVEQDLKWTCGYISYNLDRNKSSSKKYQLPKAKKTFVRWQGGCNILDGSGANGPCFFLGGFSTCCALEIWDLDAFQVGKTDSFARQTLGL